MTLMRVIKKSKPCSWQRIQFNVNVNVNVYFTFSLKWFCSKLNNNGALNDRLYLDKENSTKRVNSKQQMKHRGQHILDAV